jgi:hypothetical protein
MGKAIYHWLDKQASLKHFYAQLQRDNEVCQVTVTNHTREIREVCLWGANSHKKLTDVKTFKNSFETILQSDRNPVDLIYNIASSKYYIINEGADSLTVLSETGTIEHVIDLNIYSNVDIKGPVKIAYNSNPSHPNYGDMAIACQRADQLLIIDTDGLLKEIVNTGSEPIDVIFNTHNNRFYVANFKSPYLTMVEQNYQSYPLNGFSIPRNLGFNSSNGNVLVFDIGLEQLILIDEAGAFKNSFNGIPGSVASITFNSQEQLFYVTNEITQDIFSISADLSNILRKFKGVNQPSEIIYETNSRLIRVISTAENSLITLNSNFDIIGTESLENFNLFSLNRTSSVFLSTVEDKIKIRGTIQSPTVTVNEEYYEDREDFQHNPAMVTHVKLVASGDDRINSLRITEKSVTGTQTRKTISLNNSQSPQNFANVSELFDMEGNLIDGHVTWCFKINPLQQVSFLIYYHQIEMYNMLPEKSRISTGVQMSKGIPVSWLDNSKDEPLNESTY